MAFLFATTDDILPVLLDVEKKWRITYTPVGHFDTPAVKSFFSARDLPSLFLGAPYESAVLCPRYLVTELDAVVTSRKIAQDNGVTVWCIDQLENSGSTVISLGGLYEESVLLRGEIRTVHRDPEAKRLQRAFDVGVQKNFTKIKAFRVGRNAEALLDKGVRLTAAKQSPPSYDLSR